MTDDTQRTCVRYAGQNGTRVSLWDHRRKDGGSRWINEAAEGSVHYTSEGMCIAYDDVYSLGFEFMVRTRRGGCTADLSRDGAEISVYSQAVQSPLCILPLASPIPPLWVALLSAGDPHVKIRNADGCATLAGIGRGMSPLLRALMLAERGCDVRVVLCE